MKNIYFNIKYLLSIFALLFVSTVVSAQKDDTTIVDLGYISQPVEAISGSVETVSGKLLEKTHAYGLSQSFPGRFVGLNTIETQSDPTHTGISKLIRGISTVNGTSPLIIVDGVICATSYWDLISPKEIESVSILKDGSLNALYGMQGAAGAIVITTKRGFVGKKRIEAYVDQSFMTMTKRPMSISSSDYVDLRNQAGVNDGLGANSQFSASEVQKFKEGGDPYYPNNDWIDRYLAKMSYMQRAGVNIAGGNERIKYFSLVDYLHQTSPFVIDDEEGRKYDPTPVLHSVNFRSNLDMKLNNYISGFLRLSGRVNRYKIMQAQLTEIYPHIFYLPPTLYGPLTPTEYDENDKVTEQSNQVITNDYDNNPNYGMLNRRGYTHQIETSVMSQAGLKGNLDFITEGLAVSGSMSYQTYSVISTNTAQDYERYVRTNNLSTLEFTKKGTWENTALTYGRGAVFNYNLNLFANATYDRTFGDHSINAMAYYHYSIQEKESTSTQGMLPYKRANMGVTAAYGYQNRYFLKGDIGYSGSEQFATDYRYIATPSISASWIISKEDFLSDNAFLTYLKLRASYAINANDQLGDTRFMYLDYYDGAGNEGLMGNPYLTAEKIRKANIGLDLGIANKFMITFDYYDHYTNDMLVGSSGTVPIYQGIALANYPKLNNGEMENKGFDISLQYTERLNDELEVFAGVGFQRNKNKVIKINEAAAGDDYAYPYRTEGWSVGQQWGYLIDYSNGNGIFNSESEKTSKGLTYSFGTPRVGDWIYQDLNNDNIIDEKDRAPIGYSRYPAMYYNVTGGFTWRDFEFSFLLQGTSQSSVTVSGLGAYENSAEGVFNDFHRNAWTAERYAAGDKITYPALSLSTSTNHQANSFFVMDNTYLRLRNIELAYNIPKNISRAIAAENIRIALSAQNLFTLDNMRSDYIDPEVGSMATFQPFKVVNIGLSLTF